MSRRFTTQGILRWSAFGIAVAFAAGCSGGMTPSTVPQGNPNQAALESIEGAAYVHQQIAAGNFIQACPAISASTFRCYALGLRDRTRAPRSEMGPMGSVQGYGPAQLQQAYNITTEAQQNKGGLVVLVEAGGYPTLDKDLAVYRSQFGLPRCDRASGCLRVVNQDGRKRPHPPLLRSWIGEQAIDVDMVSANCPNCRILVVQADAATGSDLFRAERTAAKFHPMAISNSWGGDEYRAEKPAEHRIFDHPGIAITASTGDDGYGVQFPAAANTVTAVGGTTLRTASGSRGYTETAWSGAGSGCSQYIPETRWQAPIEQQLGGCTNRILADVSYEADPNTGVAVYESLSGDGEPPGWQVWGGTSVGAPAIAAIYALSGHTPHHPAIIAYRHPDALFDVSGGHNGTCSPAYLCTGEVGYDGPTGLGTPNGLGAF